jgi:hypothetical protein
LPLRDGQEDPDLARAFGSLLERTGALGYFLDETGGIVVVIPSSGSSSFDARDAASLGISVSVETRDFERAEIDAITEMVAARQWVPRVPGAREPFTIFDAKRGRVRIYTDAPVSVFQDVLDKYPGKINFVGRAIVPLRIEDIEPHWGGAVLESPQHPGVGCSSGFSVRNAQNNHRMLTAGHCYAEGARVNSPEGTTFGVVKNRSAWPNIDSELVGESGVTMEGRIYAGLPNSTTSIPVGGAADPQFGSSYCISGMQQGEKCGGTMWDSHFPNVFLFDPGKGPCPGDSGGPFFFKSFGIAYARGTIEGGADFGNPPDIPLCKQESDIGFMVLWSKITHPQNGYNVTIMTGT